MSTAEIFELIKVTGPIIVSLTGFGLLYKIYTEKVDVYKEREKNNLQTFDSMLKIKDSEIQLLQKQVSQLTEQMADRAKVETNFEKFNLEKPLIFTSNADVKSRFEKFVPFFKTIGEIDVELPDFDSDTFLLIHIYFYGIKMYDKALKFINKSIEKSPFRSNLYSYQAGTLKKLGKYREALEACELALKLDANNADAYYNMATIYALTGESDKISEPAQKAILHDISYKEIILNSGYFKAHKELLSKIR
ncbi:MAG: tetratricopeptide repeat protein [Bacteroidota bacterium]